VADENNQTIDVADTARPDVIPAEHNGGMDTDLAYGRSVWVLLVERGVEDGAELNLYWGETAAADAARRYLAQSWPIADAVPADVQDAIERYNRLSAVAEHVLLATFPIEGHQSFDDDSDQRPGCTAYGQPVLPADTEDPPSWVSADYVNDRPERIAGIDSTDNYPIDMDIA